MKISVLMALESDSWAKMVLYQLHGIWSMIVMIKAREAESDNTPCDDISENMGLTDDEMRSRRVQLLKLIIEEEKQKALPNMPTHYLQIPQCNANILNSNEIEELLEFIPHKVEHDGIEGCFSLCMSIGGYWHCRYTGIIGFSAHKSVQDALKEVILWIRNGMVFPK